ncbi:MAG: NADH-quinone oxidoreductase subunit L [Legionellales bacterium]|nr:MAG: NADH-quinone oxidoreductase subunit L [Legionellales bacterium]
MLELELLIKFIVMLPLAAAILTNYWGRYLTTLATGMAFTLAAIVAANLGDNTLNIGLYTWANLTSSSLQVGFLVDKLTTLMLLVVTGISFLVHIYTLGYMRNDPGVLRFFSYIALFTFAMLLLVLSDNLLGLFAAWELVGLVSYLLIGFWFHKDSAVKANFKAFLVNRVADVGLILAIAAIFMHCNSLQYSTIFSSLSTLDSGTITFIAICLFIGAMGKSAQFPLHVWLPDSMEGPTPISALIHAATMVTAGVYLLARMEPLFSLAPNVLDLILVIGAITSLLLGLVAITATDLKRIIAYSTISQLGYMMVAIGSANYAIGIFHLATHACFKALLFLGAGAVIMSLQHEQDIRKMGNIKKYMPVTYITMLLGCLALVGMPGFAGFYSKDLIIAGVAHSNSIVAPYVYWTVLVGVFITAVYTFRMFFLVFHTKERMDTIPKEIGFIMYLPLIILALASVSVGALLLEGHDAYAMALHSIQTIPFYCMLAGIATAWICYVQYPNIPNTIVRIINPVYKLIYHKYYLDCIIACIIVPGTRLLSNLFYKLGDRFMIETVVVNGIPKLFMMLANKLRWLQTGYLPQYILLMVVALIIFMAVL